MSDELTRRVASAMGARDYAQAKTAIREVLRWYSVPAHINDDMMHEVHNSVSDNEGVACERTIAAAMRAELERLRGEK